VYVGLSERHAYVLLRVAPESPGDLGWLIVEPQVGDWLVADPSELTDPLAQMYDTRCYFNDCGFHAGAPWRD